MNGAEIDDVRFLAFAGGFVDENEFLALIYGTLQSDEAAPKTDLDGVGFAHSEALVCTGLKNT
jgi:hypothetical protein